MPKLRQTCTRCSMRRQKCDRKTPCSRCVQNREAHLCTTEWTEGYNPNVHRKYPRKGSTPNRQTSHNGNWPSTPLSEDGDRRYGLAHRERSFSTGSSIDPNAQSQEAQSGTNLDFITYGGSDYADVSIGTLLSSSKDSFNKPLMDQSLNQVQNLDMMSDSSSTVGGFSAAARAVEVYHIRSLLPEKSQIFKLMDYHEKYMLYWQGGIYHAPTFKKTLRDAYGQSNALEVQNLDWRWTALLFSILSASVIGSPDAVSTSWGFPVADKVRLARNWGNATITCLILGDYASNFHIYSVQAILNLHTSEHLVGSAKEFVVYQNAAVAIARGIGLHRLSAHPDDSKVIELNAEQKDALLQREMGRRVWYALTSQDWLCTTSQGLYNIQPRHFTTIKPGYFVEETMLPAPDGEPTLSVHTNYLNQGMFALYLITLRLCNSRQDR
ncbi:hypothetical protein BDV96DRAFT_240049 [Lophiotrema nucula]|uniref:Zn(2)-C6 fungal-type domain-containing protein n=1 Tax=Lophiotrema nucula TaxID=690887 RepID=A0A6A5YQC7_9PLEO|nr:hypothetical protein BDV96DRAFT_240049 [Lophiotrema nucula]